MAYLARHPILLLLLFSPGIPEYLSGSSPVAAIVLNPGQFLFQLVANLGLYGPGVLLVREALVRGRKSWPSLLAFGCAYAILEEGVALATMFNPQASVVGSLGSYGHYLGVNWVWSIGLLMVHTVCSLSLPIVLLSLTLPETRGRPLLSSRQIGVLFAIWAADVGGLFSLVLFGLHFWMGGILLGGSFALIGALAMLGARLPPSSPAQERPLPRWRPVWFVVPGFVLFPGTIGLEGVLSSVGLPAALTVLAVAGFYGVWGIVTIPGLGRRRNERALVALAAGLLAPLMVFGIAGNLAFPLVAVGDIAVLLLLVHLWARYPAPPVPSPVPAGASGFV